MTTKSFAAEQRRFFHAQCMAMTAFLAAAGLRALVIMAHREIFSIYCDGNQPGWGQPAPVNDNQPRR